MNEKEGQVITITLKPEKEGQVITITLKPNLATEPNFQIIIARILF
jgi:hypothetical protein